MTTPFSLDSTRWAAGYFRSRTARVTSGFTRFTATRMRSTGPLPTEVTGGRVERNPGKSTTSRGGMSRAGSIVPTWNVPVHPNATRVDPSTVVVSTLVRAEPGDGFVTTVEEGPGAAGASAGGGTAAGVTVAVSGCTGGASTRATSATGSGSALN